MGALDASQGFFLVDAFFDDVAHGGEETPRLREGRQGLSRDGRQRIEVEALRFEPCFTLGAIFLAGEADHDWPASRVDIELMKSPSPTFDSVEAILCVFSVSLPCSRLDDL